MKHTCHTARKKITQDTFDAAVKENVDEFGMDLEEAIADAIEQFEAQGVDLKGIITSADGQAAAADADHPVGQAVEALRAAVEQQSDQVNALLSALAQEVKKDDGYPRVAGLKGAMELVLSSLKSQSTSTDHILTPLETLQALVTEQSNQDKLGDEGVVLLCQLLRENASHPGVLEKTLQVIRAACTKAEANRQKFVGEGVTPLLPKVIQTHLEHLGAVREACFVMRVLTFNDDERVVAGRGHDHARRMWDDGAIDVMFDSLKTPTAERDGAVVGELCATISKLIVKDEMCTAIVARGGMDDIVSHLERHINTRTVARHVLAVLKSLAGNDEVKVAIAQGPALKLVLRAMEIHSDSAPTQEQGCALLAALCLRNPENAHIIADHGGVTAILSAMKAHPEAARVQKNACLAIRNLVVRSPDLQPVVLEAGAEALIRKAMRTDASCVDNAKAALRDLHVD